MSPYRKVVSPLIESVFSVGTEDSLSNILRSAFHLLPCNVNVFQVQIKALVGYFVVIIFEPFFFLLEILHKLRSIISFSIICWGFLVTLNFHGT